VWPLVGYVMLMFANVISNRERNERRPSHDRKMDRSIFFQSALAEISSKSSFSSRKARLWYIVAVPVHAMEIKEGLR
jgi:hypothetical protein